MLLKVVAEDRRRRFCGGWHSLAWRTYNPEGADVFYGFQTTLCQVTLNSDWNLVSIKELDEHDIYHH